MSLVSRRTCAVLMMLAFLSGGCWERAGDGTTTARQQAATVPDVLVSADWLAGAMRDGQVTVVDARSHEEYTQGHIEGAINLPATKTTVPSASAESNTAPVSQIQEVFSQAGIDASRPVIIYDGATDYRAAAQLFWVLEVHGHPAVAVLNGGLAAWHKQNRAVSVQPFELPRSKFIANMQPHRLATKLAVAQAIQDPKVVILDSRSEEEYVGLKSKASRAGHIPSAVHINAASALARDSNLCTMRDTEQLGQLFAGLPGNARIITYCNTGRSAAINYLALRSMHRDVAVYDGSWMEWANDHALPIKTDKKNVGVDK